MPPDPPRLFWSPPVLYTSPSTLFEKENPMHGKYCANGQIKIFKGKYRLVSINDPSFQ